MTIRTIVFDFGNVLGHFSHTRAAEQLAAFAPPGVTAEQIRAVLADADLEDRLESGQLPASHFLGLLRNELGLAGSDEELALAYADMFSPNEPVCALVPRLHGLYRLVLLSNTTELHYRQFRRQFAAVLDCFDALVVSHEVGVRKPHAQIYQHVCALACSHPGECLFIDDLPANVEGARQAGWRGIVYRASDDLDLLLRQAGVRLAA
jgi:putative hydrolase of the HAD superfamily